MLRGKLCDTQRTVDADAALAAALAVHVQKLGTNDALACERNKGMGRNVVAQGRCKGWKGMALVAKQCNIRHAYHAICGKPASAQHTARLDTKAAAVCCCNEGTRAHTRTHPQPSLAALTSESNDTHGSTHLTSPLG
jgi:hypothetical protein